MVVDRHPHGGGNRGRRIVRRQHKVSDLIHRHVHRVEILVTASAQGVAGKLSENDRRRDVINAQKITAHVIRAGISIGADLDIIRRIGSRVGNLNQIRPMIVH